MRYALIAAIALCLALFFCLPQDSLAVIYTQEKDDGLFLTNDKRKVSDELRPSREPEIQPQQQTAAQKASKREMQLARMAFKLENAFKSGNPDRVLEFFNFFPDKSTPRQQYTYREKARSFFSLFFETFGPTGSLVEGNTSQEKQQLSRIYAVDATVLDTLEFDFAYHNFLAPLKSGKGGVWINVGICTPKNPDQLPWIKDMAIALVEPDAAMQAKAQQFTSQYKQAISDVNKRYAEIQEKQNKRRKKDLEERKRALHEKIEQARKTAEKQPPKSQASSPDSQASSPKPQATAQQQQAPKEVGPMTMPQTGLPGTGMDMAPGMGNPMMLLGMLSGTIITGLLVVSVFFYLFYCMSLYIIARKLDVTLPWLAWIPVAQTHPQVLAAGLPAWWTAAIIGSFLLSFIPFVGVLLSLAVMVVFVYLWMRISERLGLNKWLGLLIILPIVQFLYPAWLAFKNDAYRPHVDLKNIITKTVLALLLFSALSWALTTYVITPMLEPMLSMVNSIQQQGQMPQGLPQPTQPEALPQQTQPESQARPKRQAQPEKQPAPKAQAPAAPQQQAGFKSLSRKEYEKLLANAKAPLQGSAKMPHIRLGPALVRYDTFWADPEKPHFWLKVVLPMVPNLTLGKTGRLLINKVLDKSGNDVFDKDNSFEKGQFTKLAFQKSTFQTPRLEAIRDVHLLSGATEAALASVSGELTLQLPLDIKPLELTAADTTPQELHGFFANVKSIEDNKASLVFTGNLDNHVGTIAYDADGNKLDSQFSSWNTSGDTTRITYGYPETPQRIQLLVASDLMEKKYPFTLELK